LPEHEANLAAANTDIPCWHVRIFTKMPMQLGHEGLAEAHDLAIRAATRIEVRSAFAAANRQAGQRVLEDLLKTKELDDAQIDRRVETNAALVRPQRRIELNTEASVDLHLALIVDPRHAKDNLALGLADTLDQRIVGIIRMLGNHAAETFQDFTGRLVEFILL